MRIYILIFILLISNTLFSQNKATISGIVSIDNKKLPDAVVEFQINKTSKYSVTNKNGNYKFSNASIGDSLYIKFQYIGYKPYLNKVLIVQENTQIDINLIEIDFKNLDEVIVKGKEKIISSAKKDSYKINSKDFIQNAKAPEALATIPNVSLQDEKVIVDGNLTAKIFIDGIEAMQSELKTIDVADIDRVEVMNNPSQSYGSDFTGAVVNIISKKKTQEFFKGSTKVSRALKYDNWYATPSISYKRGRVIFKSMFSYQINNSIVNNEISRSNNGDDFFANSINNAKGIKKNSETRLNVKLSEKSNLDISNSIYGYKFVNSVNGYSFVNNDLPINYVQNGEYGTTDWDISSVYSYNIKENKKLFLKSKYRVYDDFNKATFLYSNATSNNNDIESKNTNLTFSIDYEVDEFLLFKKKSTFYSGAKFINRRFTFLNTDYYANQNVANIYSEVDSEWSKTFSSEVSLMFENTKNYNKIALNQQYNYFLPAFNLLYKFKNNYKAKFGYSRKILRPSADDLNDQLIIYNPGFASQGNSKLLPQTRNYFFVSLNKTIKSNNFSLKIYKESLNNSMENTYKASGNLMISTIENIAKANVTGMNLGVRTKLFKKVEANINTGFDYSIYEDKEPFALINKVEGYTFRSDINLSARILKDKLFLSFSGNQKGPNYSLLSKDIFNPYLDFSATTNLFKNKINLSLYAGNLTGVASYFNKITSYSNFYQNSSFRTNSRNISIAITYNFGKKFDDTIDDNNINNDDIRK